MFAFFKIQLVLLETMEYNLTILISESNKKQILIDCKLPRFLKNLFI